MTLRSFWEFWVVDFEAVSLALAFIDHTGEEVQKA